MAATGAPLWVTADPARLEQVLHNLLDNALKFSPGGGADRVDLGPEAGGARLTVADEGIGLPPGAAGTIFEPFARAANAAREQLPGLGLGLHVCRGIVEQHGGRIWAGSEGEGRGTTVGLWLPAGDGEGAGQAAADGQAEG